MMKKTIIPFLLLSGLTLAGCASQETTLSVDDELARYESLLEESDVSENSREVAEVSDRQAAVEEQKSLAGAIEAEEESAESSVDLSDFRDEENVTNDKVEEHDIVEESERDLSVNNEPSDVPETIEELNTFYLENYYVEEQAMDWINSASEEELQQVSGIGPVHAADIASNRSYSNVEEVIETSNGIGPQIFYNILQYLGLSG